MADENDVLFKEIEEEIRQDKAYQFWNTYRFFIIFLVVALIASVAIFQFWQDHNISQKSNRGEAFNSLQALMRSGDIDPALSALKKFSTEQNDGYARLAQFSEAALLDDKNGEAAVDIYRKLASDTSLLQTYRDLAVILGALRQIEKAVKSNDLIGKLHGMIALNNPWRHSAKEIIALSALQAGDNKRGISLLKDIISDATTPKNTVTRLKEFLKSVE